MDLELLKRVMRNLTAIFCLFLLCANGCKSPQSDENPQDDDQEISSLFSAPQATGELQVSDLDEASGLVNSRSNPEYLWSHNDSGGDPVLYLFTLQGADSGRYELSGAQNRDWEDLAIGAGPDDNLNYLYAADIGDNNAVRESLNIYRVPEPDVSEQFGVGGARVDLPATATLNDVETINYIYEDGARDAESIFVDPETRDIYIITKREPSVILYKLSYPQSTTEQNTAERVMVLPFTFVVAADISPSGNEVLIKNYSNVYHWAKSGNESIQELLATQPSRLNYRQEPQGEAIAWATDESGYFTLSESNGDTPVIYSYSRN